MSSYVSVANAIKEFEHWLRLTCFLHDPIKNALLQVLHNKLKDPSYQGIPDNPVALYQFFLNNKNTLNQLVKKKLLKKEQLDLLLPQGGNQTFSSEFDVTLIAFLIQDFTTLPPPKKGWKTKNPPPTDTSLAAFVIRAREWRNFINHIDAKTIDLLLFQKKWQEGCDIINGLRYQYNTKFLETMPLDPKHDSVLKGLKSCMAKFKSSQKGLSTGIQDLQNDVSDIQNNCANIQKDVTNIKHENAEFSKDLKESQKKVTEIENTVKSQDQSITDINNDIDGRFDEFASQIESISQAVELHNTLDPKKSNTENDDCCLTEVRQYVSSEIGDQKDKLLQRLGKENNKGLSVEEAIENVSWLDLKKNLLKVGRHDMVDHIERNTLITEGLYAASRLLKQKTIKKLIDLLVQEPFSPSTSNTCYVPREEQFVNLTILNSKEYEERLSNSDREVLMKQRFKEREGVTMNEIFKVNDEIVVVRGVGGSGKTSLVGMYNLKWAKGELDTGFQIEFMFTFACRELNNIVDQKTTLEELFKTCYPEVFELITLDDLRNLGSRVMIIIDGIDELHNIYGIEDKSTTAKPHAQIVRQLIDQNRIPGHKTFICGRPKACQFLRNTLLDSKKTKIVEVCGFTEQAVYEYVRKFFKDKKEKTERLIKQLEESDNLRQMCTIPVFLWIVCHIFNEEIIPGNLETITEIYFYSWLVFLRNHFRIEDSSECLDFYSIVNSQKILRSILTLMKLSTKLYIDNKVLFSAKEVEGVQSEFDLEKTGFITKFEGGAQKEPTYQFAHLVFQEFFTGVYLWITRSTSKYSSNRELTSCLPTLLGIQRMLNDKENELFIGFVNNLQQISDEAPKTLSAKAKDLYNRLKFKKYIANNMELPKCMVQKQTVVIDMNETKCTDFLASYFESRFEVKSIRRFKNFQAKGFHYNRMDERNAHFFVTRHNLLAELPPSCQVIDSLLKVEDEFQDEFQYEEWLSFVYEGQHLIDKSKLPQNVAIDDSYPVNNESYYFLGSLYFLTQITQMEQTDLPAEFLLDNKLLVGGWDLKKLEKFCDVVHKENLELHQLDFCLVNIEGALNFDIEKLIFILQRTNIKTIEIPENYIEVQETKNKETFVLKDTAQHCSSFIERLEKEKFTVIRKGLSFDQVKGHSPTSEKLEDINHLLQNSNVGTFQFPIDHYDCRGRLWIDFDEMIWLLKLEYLNNYKIDLSNIHKVTIFNYGSKYKKVENLLDEINIEKLCVKADYFDGIENDVELIKLGKRAVGCSTQHISIYHFIIEPYISFRIKFEESIIRLDYSDCDDVNNFVECYIRLYEHFSPKNLTFGISDEDIEVPSRLETAKRIFSYSIEKGIKILMQCGNDGHIFLTDNKFDTYENLQIDICMYD
ncbi:uncharacterized protein [Clytia hemisphaerica]|uniref:NACHT domain-containing protein n=1 Tax=Clytia hemisphaerica TaxID=252671 RepID=A0A7M5VB30_9CNID